MEAAALISLEDLRPDGGQLSNLFIGNRHEVNCFGLQGINRASVNQVQAQEDEVTKVFGSLVVTIVNKFHLKQDVNE